MRRGGCRSCDVDASDRRREALLAYWQPWRDSVLDRGFAFDDGEFDDELQSIAVPVADRSGNVLIAIGVTTSAE